MLQMQAFAYSDPFPSWFANSLGKALSVLSSRFSVSQADNTHVQVIAGANDQAAVISIGGLWRWMEATVGPVAHPGGAAGVYPAFVTARANSITNVPRPLSDHTDYSFGLVVLAPGGTPAISAGVVDVFRHVADVVWDGAKITRVDQLVPVLPNHAGRHAAGGPDPLTPAAIGALAATGHLAELTDIHASRLTLGLAEPARRYRTAALSMGTNAWWPLPLDTVDYDVDGQFAGDGFWHAPAPGTYRFSGQVLVPAAANPTVNFSGLLLWPGGGSGWQLIRRGSPGLEPQALGVVASNVISTVKINTGDAISLAVFANVTNLQIDSPAGASNYLEVERVR